MSVDIKCLFQRQSTSNKYVWNRKPAKCCRDGILRYTEYLDIYIYINNIWEREKKFDVLFIFGWWMSDKTYPMP